MKRFAFKLNGTVQVFRLGKTTNNKIANPKVNIVQSYTFSEDQYNYIRQNMLANTKAVFKDFFALDAKNCFDCPFSANANAEIGKCYTHKMNQYSGFISMLKSMVNQYGDIKNIPTYSDTIIKDLVKISTNRYVRFGTYGEPSIHPIEVVSSIANVASTWTGYTHQYMKKANKEFNDYFMASTHNQLQANTAINKFGYRSFIAVKDNSDIKAIVCPASKEGNFKATCADCGLCSGVLGKGKKDVVILQH
jgi:hypothetical protein